MTRKTVCFDSHLGSWGDLSCWQLCQWTWLGCRWRVIGGRVLALLKITCKCVVNLYCRVACSYSHFYLLKTGEFLSFYLIVWRLKAIRHPFRSLFLAWVAVVQLKFVFQSSSFASNLKMILFMFPSLFEQFKISQFALMANVFGECLRSQVWYLRLSGDTVAHLASCNLLYDVGSLKFYRYQSQHHFNAPFARVVAVSSTPTVSSL